MKQLLLENQRRQDVAISLHYDSSPESSPPIPRKASTPSVAGAKEKLLSPLLMEKKVLYTQTCVQTPPDLHCIVFFL